MDGGKYFWLAGSRHLGVNSQQVNILADNNDGGGRELFVLVKRPGRQTL
jgi:hypothetical protein